MKAFGLNELREMFLSFLNPRGTCACRAFRSSRRTTRRFCL